MNQSPKIKTALKPIRPPELTTKAGSTADPRTNQIKISPSTTHDQPTKAPTQPTQIVDIGFYLEIIARPDRDTLGWLYFTGEPPQRGIVIVLNADRAIVKRLLLEADSELTGFFAAWLLMERLRACPDGSGGKEVFWYLRNKLVPEKLSADNDWLASRLSSRDWFRQEIAKAPIYEAEQSLGEQY